MQTSPRTANRLQIADNHRMGMRKTSRTPIEREACENEKGILPIWHFCRENHQGGFAAPIPFSRIRRLFATAPTSRIKAAEHRSLILLKPRRRGFFVADNDALHLGPSDGDGSRGGRSDARDDPSSCI